MDNNSPSSPTILPPSPSFTDLVNYSIQSNTAYRESQSRFTSIVVNKKTSTARDILNICITVIIGAVTLYSVAPHLVKTKTLFFVSMALLLAATILAVYFRLRITNYLSQAVFSIEDRHVRFMRAAEAALADQTNTVAINNLVTVAQEEVRLPNAGWMINFGEVLVAFLFIAGIIGIGVAVLFRITS